MKLMTATPRFCAPQIRTGSGPAVEVKPGTVAYITTGSPVPQGQTSSGQTIRRWHSVRWMCVVHPDHSLGTTLSAFRLT